jgi:hypothetical protein
MRVSQPIKRVDKVIGLPRGSQQGPSVSMSQHRQDDEYRALRATIRARGTARVWVFLAGLGFWGVLAVATATLEPVPLATLVPLLVLAGAFECVFALHVGIERVGRYLQVFYEDRWEQLAMKFGTPTSGTRPDALFVVFFALATLLNFVPVLVAGAVPIELIVVGGAHMAFLGRLALARQAAGRQRAADLLRFEQLQRDS